jgi:3-deoxy-D-manno-octulosonic-acid transferase
MIINIKKDDGENIYNVNEIADEAKQGEARVIISKVGTLETLSEAINFASATHRANLEKILESCDEALMVEPAKEEVSETKIITEDTKDK